MTTVDDAGHLHRPHPEARWSTMPFPSEFGREKGVDPRALIWIGGCAGVAASGNAIRDLGPGMAQVCAGGPPGLASGFAIAGAPAP